MIQVTARSVVRHVCSSRATSNLNLFKRCTSHISKDLIRQHVADPDSGNEDDLQSIDSGPLYYEDLCFDPGAFEASTGLQKVY